MYFNFDINAYTYSFKIQKNDIKKNWRLILFQLFPSSNMFLWLFYF